MERDPTTLTLTELARAYREGACTPTDVTERFLERIEVGPTWRIVLAERARRQAAAATRAFEAGLEVGPLMGIPLGLKDLLDVEGEITVAGSAALLARGERAERDAPVVARLDAAGAVFLGKTHMTELAFSGLGLNMHFGTPGSVHDASRVPGGSSSGSAIAVAAGEATAAIGSDTGGSVRIPAAAQGLVGLKVSEGSLPTEGAFPLSTTLDTIGPITRTLEDAWAVWRALRAMPPAPFPRSEGALRFAVPPTVLREDLEDEVREAFEALLDRLEQAGHELDRSPRPLLEEVHGLYGRYGSFASHEALALHEELLDTASPRIDARVEDRIRAVQGRPASDYLRLGYARDALRRQWWQELAGFDAVLAPTIAIRPPRIADVDGDVARYFEENGKMLRNTTLFNILGGAAVTTPMTAVERGIGAMIATPDGTEAHALAVAARVRDVLAG